MSEVHVQLAWLFILAFLGVMIIATLASWVFHESKRALGYTLVILFTVAWIIHLWTGWMEFSAEQLALGEVPHVYGDDGYAWVWLSRSTENIMSEFLQLAAFVILTSFLIFQGSPESRDGQDRLERKVDRIITRLEDKS